jgi:hypothetical protein
MWSYSNEKQQIISRCLRNPSAVSEAPKREAVTDGQAGDGRFRYSGLKGAVAHDDAWVLNASSSVVVGDRPGFCETDKHRREVFEGGGELTGADLRWKIGRSGREECGWRHTKPVRVGTGERFALRSSLS